MPRGVPAGAVPLDPPEPGYGPELATEATADTATTATTAATATAATAGGGPPSPPRPRIAGPLEAFLAHPFLTLFPVVLLVGGALFLGLQRDPEYTATSRVTVGNTDVAPFLLEEVVAGNQALAASYSRAIVAGPVTAAAGRRVGLSPDTAADRLSATNVPQSTLISVEATGPSERSSVALANAGAQSLIDYIKRLNRTDEAADLFRDYQKAQGEARRAERRTQRLLKSSRRNSPEATRARIKQDLAALRASDLANRYRAASGVERASSRLTLIAPAARADSDRRQTLEGLLLISVVGGLVLGFALALLRTNWHVLRALRRT